MPKLKVDHILSFSSEDPAHVANNILSSDSLKKWKSRTAGEKSAVIILQLEKACVISSVDIGNEHSAYVEVLVGRSSSPDDYKVLLVMSSFMTPLEARQSTNANKVRMFKYEDFQSPERDQKWDRVKIVCTQPFNRHVQYGLAFVTLNGVDSPKEPTAVGNVKLGGFTLRPSSPDQITAGSLFARRKELSQEAPLTAAAAIREATNASLGGHSPKVKPRLKDLLPSPKNSSSSKLPSTSKDSQSSSTTESRRRNRDEILYKRDEEEPNTKIDKLIEEKNKELERQKREALTKAEKEKAAKAKAVEERQKQEALKKKNESKNAVTSPSTSKERNTPSTKRKFNGEDIPLKRVKPMRQERAFNKLLDGVAIVISGIQNPERATIRDEALALGAKYKADWDNTCTHLICAFTNTPKFNQVKGKGKIVNRLWIADCQTQRKRLPWRRYALDSKDQQAPESEDEIWELQERKPKLTDVIESSSSTDTEDEADNAQALLHAQEKLHQTVFNADTDEETLEPRHSSLRDLPEFLSSKVFYIDKHLKNDQIQLLLRYISAYNGILVDEPSDVVDFALSAEDSASILKELCSSARVVRPEWMWECHNSKELVEPDAFLL